MEDFLNSGKVSCHRNAPHCIEDATPSLGALNLLELKNRLPELQQYMEDNQYTAPYIRKVILKAEKIIVLSGKIVWNTIRIFLTGTAINAIPNETGKGVKDRSAVQAITKHSKNVFFGHCLQRINASFL